MKTIVEIGGGRNPYFVRFAMPVEDSAEYVCLDVSEENIREGEASLRAHAAAGKPMPGNHVFMLHDAVKLPFDGMYADHIVISNTLSAPIHHAWDRNGTQVSVIGKSRPIRANQYDGDPFYAERKPIVEEAIRILKPGGVLHIYTDLIVYGAHSYQKILNELAHDPRLVLSRNREEEAHINALNREKIESSDYCCCFRAEVLPEAEVYEYIKR